MKSQSFLKKGTFWDPKTQRFLRNRGKSQHEWDNFFNIKSTDGLHFPRVEVAGHVCILLVTGPNNQSDPCNLNLRRYPHVSQV